MNNFRDCPKSFLFDDNWWIWTNQEPGNSPIYIVPTKYKAQETYLNNENLDVYKSQNTQNDVKNQQQTRFNNLTPAPLNYVDSFSDVGDHRNGFTWPNT